MSGLAVVVLAHADPAHLRRLIAALDDLPVFLHCDAKTSPALFGQMVQGLPRRVRVLPRIRTSISSWSLVEAELLGLRAAVTGTSAEHIAVVSGADYPLVSVPELLGVLRQWHGCSYFYNVPVPFPQWSTRRNPDGGEWRFRYRFASWRGQLVSWRGIPLHWPIRRALPAGLTLRASSQWKILSREHVQLLLRVADSRPGVMRFWRTTFVPDESFAASVLSSPALVGSSALRPCRANPWYYQFPPGGQHPKWLTTADFARIAAARRGPAIAPAAAFVDPSLAAPAHGKLFARKFSSAVDTAVLDQLDAQLRG